MQDLLASLGHGVSRAVIETDFAWLAEQGLVEVEQLGPLAVATMTGRGIDVAEGRATVPGVKRPRPRDLA